MISNQAKWKENFTQQKKKLQIERAIQNVETYCIKEKYSQKKNQMTHKH